MGSGESLADRLDVGLAEPVSVGCCEGLWLWVGSWVGSVGVPGSLGVGSLECVGLDEGVPLGSLVGCCEGSAGDEGVVEGAVVPGTGCPVSLLWGVSERLRGSEGPRVPAGRSERVCGSLRPPPGTIGSCSGW